MNENKKGFNVKARLLLISAIPAIIIGVAVLITGILFMKTGMEEEVLKGLLSSAYAYRDTGLVNANREKGDNDIENELKKDTGYDFTWFEGDTRKNSSLGKSVIDTKAVPVVISEVINNKKEFTSTKTEVAGEEYFVAYVPALNSNGEVIGMAFTGVSRQAVEGQITKSIIIMLVIVLVLIVFTILVALRAATKMSGAIKEIEESITQLSYGRFVKSDEYLNRSDEIGNALRSANNLIDKLTEVIKDIHEASEFVGMESSELARTSANISETTDGVSDAVMQMAKGATEQAETIQDATQNISDLSDAIKNVAGHSERLAVTAHEMNEDGRASSTALKKLCEEMIVMHKSVNSIMKTISDTNQAVQMVNQKTESITNIASQTNLLALNASIEAARAGETGKGFAVVAEEIGKLAVESSNTAKEIREEMAKLLSQSNDAQNKTDDVSVICQSVTKILEDTEIKINDLIKNVDLTVDGVTTISALTQECEAAKSVIVDAMGSLSAISEENAASTEETSASMLEVNSAVNVLADASKKLKQVSEKLDKELKFFKI